MCLLLQEKKKKKNMTSKKAGNNIKQMKASNRSSRSVGFRALVVSFVVLSIASIHLYYRGEKKGIPEDAISSHNNKNNHANADVERKAIDENVLLRADDLNLLQYPLPENQVNELLAKVEERNRAYCKSFFTMKNVNTMSQNKQDFWLFANYFYKMAGAPGVFLDIGGNDPINLSNTYFFETCLGWKGKKSLQKKKTKKRMFVVA